MSKQEILVVSFGTSYQEAEKRGIYSVIKEIETYFPDFEVSLAYTSGMVRKILKKRGSTVPSVEEALDQMQSKGIRDVFIQPTLLIYGEEYEKIIKAINLKKENFDTIKVGTPLLGNTEDMKKIAHILHEEHPLQPEEGLVLMGHGSTHFCNMAYASMEYICHEQGFENMFMATIEAYPELDIVISKIKKAKIRKVILIPFLLVAGDHAKNDMAGAGDTSWKNRLRQAGIEVEVVFKGLGEYSGIREIYSEHVKNMLN